MLTGVSSLERSIRCLLKDMFEYERVAYQPTDIILRPTTLNQVHTMKIGGLRTCMTPLEFSYRAKSMVQGAILGTFHDYSGLCQGQFWHEWAGCGCAYVFQSLGTYNHCCEKEMGWFATYPKPRTLRNITNP